MTPPYPAAIIAMSVALTASIASAESQFWSCSNQDIEIVCDDGKCERNIDKSAMSITFVEPDDLTICAYSGCWETKDVTVSQGPDHLFVFGDALDWNFDDSRDGETALLSIQPATGFGSIIVVGYVNPLICERHDVAR